MTVSSLVTKAIYAGNGSTKIFPITFTYTDETEIEVYLTDLLGVNTKVVSNLDINTSTDQVTYPVSGTAIPIGTKLTISRVTALVQEVDLTNQGYFNPETIERAFDKVTRISQELSEKLSRCVAFPLNESPTTLDTESFLLTIEAAKNLAIAAQVAAELAKTQTEAVLDSFDDTYLGSKASDPTLDNDGNTLVVGCLYFNTALSKMRVWSGAVWDSISSGDSSVKYTLSNNQALTDITGLLLNSATEKSVFFKFEIERIGASEYRQVVDAQAFYDGTIWAITFGNFSGSDLRQDALTTDESITLSITSGGQVQYSSGNLASHTSSTLKVIQSKMEV